MLHHMLPRKPEPIRFDPFAEPSEAEKREARAVCLEERARTVEQAGEPVVQAFRSPSFHDLMAEEQEQRDAIAENARTVIYGTGATPRQMNDLEGGAMYLVRRSIPAWLKAAREQAVEALLATDEFRALMRDRSLAEARVLAHRFAETVRAAEIGTLESERSVSTAVYLKTQAAAIRAGAR